MVGLKQGKILTNYFNKDPNQTIILGINWDTKAKFQKKT